MWRNVFRVFAAVELALVALEALFHPPWLPLAGGHLGQIAILFIGGFVVLEMIEFLRDLRGEKK